MSTTNEPAVAAPPSRAEGTSRLLKQAIVLLSFAAFTSSMATRALDSLLPQIMHAFSVSAGEAARAISGFAVVYGLLQAVYGPWGDKTGKYKLIGWTTLALAFGSLLCALAMTLDQLVAARMLAGAAAAAIIPLSMAWIGDKIPYAERQATLARFLTGQILGVIGGQFLGGVFADTFGWRWLFVVLALVNVGVGLRLRAMLRRSPELLGEAQREAGAGRMPLKAQFGAVFRQPWARVVLVTVMLEGAVMFGALPFVPTYLHQRFHLSMTAAGALMGCYGLGGALYAGAVKRFVGRLGERGLALSGGVGLGLAYLILYLAPTWPWAVLSCVLAGTSFYSIHNTLQTNATQMAPAVRGTAVSVFAEIYFIGQAAGVMGAAVLVDRAGAPVLFAIAAAALPLIGLALNLALPWRNKWTKSA